MRKKKNNEKISTCVNFIVNNRMYDNNRMEIPFSCRYKVYRYRYIDPTKLSYIPSYWNIVYLFVCEPVLLPPASSLRLVHLSVPHRFMAYSEIFSLYPVALHPRIVSTTSTFERGKTARWRRDRDSPLAHLPHSYPQYRIPELPLLSTFPPFSRN